MPKEKKFVIIIKNKNNPELIREIFNSRSNWIEAPVFLSACYTVKWAPSNRFLEYNLLTGNKVSGKVLLSIFLRWLIILSMNQNYVIRKICL